MARQAEKLTIALLTCLLPLACPAMAESRNDHSLSAPTPLIQRGWGFSVQAVLNGKVPCELRIDTGSTFTVISTRMAKRLGLAKRLKTAPRYPLNAAGGLVWVRLVMLDKLKVGDVTAYRVEGAVADLPSFKEVDGLLGRSFLDLFSFMIDSGASSIRFSLHNSAPLYGSRGKGWWTSQAKRLRKSENLFRAMQMGVEKSVYTGDTPDRLLMERLSKNDAIALAAYFGKLVNDLELEAESLGVPEEWIR